ACFEFLSEGCEDVILELMQNQICNENREIRIAIEVKKVLLQPSPIPRPGGGPRPEIQAAVMRNRVRVLMPKIKSEVAGAGANFEHPVIGLKEERKTFGEPCVVAHYPVD